MKPLFALTIFVEPDRHRFVRFATEAIRQLGGNPFAAASRMVAVLERLREEGERTQGVVNARLLVDDDRLLASCGDHTLLVASLPEPPTDATLTHLAARLRQASETADPELLMRRNRQVSAELERARSHAAQELAELEAQLEKKKQELQQSIVRAETDGLTGLLNRRAYDSRLREAIARTARQHQPLALLLLDLDHFKSINDEHGHQYGDRYLRRMADALRQAARDGVDHLCRFGGDEFAVIAYSDLNAAHSIAHRVLEMMEGQVSIGVAQREDHDTAKALEGRADAALYEAKRLGRGRIVTASGSELLSSGASR